MVYRIYVEKIKGFDSEASALASDIRSFLRIESVSSLRIINRYDVENIDSELFDYCKKAVFSKPDLDICRDTLGNTSDCVVFAVEYLPGQFDQRADSAAQCIQAISNQERPSVRTAKVYMLYGDISADETDAIKKHIINPVESREASLGEYATLDIKFENPADMEILDGFIDTDFNGLSEFVEKHGLAMDLDDITFCRDYFKSERRNPTITEIRMIDAYWSDHCRHTTFLTTIDNVVFEDELLRSAYEDYLAVRKEIGSKKPINLMDLATITAKLLKKNGKLPRIDESEEVNACTVKIDVDVDGEIQKWLLLFKNETHNHPTEIEPFGGAATCIGGAIRDPLSGRSYVYAAMRLTGASDPTKPLSETLEGKLPQRTIVTTAAAGYSSYANQVGITAGQIDEIYHGGYVAKRMEVGAVIAAAPAENVRRETPVAGDCVILLGGKTGRDGCGGAAGSSKPHTLQSLESCGAEVQKGNAPEGRKLQRLFRNKNASLLIKRCNDFGAGGVSVAIGELADGLVIDLNSVPTKYGGLDGTELAISESQERMAVVVASSDVGRFKELAESENLEATVVAVVSDEPRLVMKWNGKEIVNISREFLNSNGAEKHIDITPAAPLDFDKEVSGEFDDLYFSLASDLNVCSKRGLSERFDSTVGAGTVLMPFGGKYMLTPAQAMVNKISVQEKDTDTCSLMAWGYNPFISEKSPYHGGYLAVVESVSKIIAAGASFDDVYLTFQEYFEKLGHDGKRWGKPLAALLGAFKAQVGLQIASIGGKDSMSGSFEDIDVPPTLISFAVTTDSTRSIVSPEFKAPDRKVVLIKPDYDKNGLPTADSLVECFSTVTDLIRSGSAVSVYTPTYGGIAEAVMKMSFGNGIGFDFSDELSLNDIFGYNYGSFLIELCDDREVGIAAGKTTDKGKITRGEQEAELSALLAAYENKLESVFACNIPTFEAPVKNFSYKSFDRPSPAIKAALPRVLIPVFPGTNCEYDTAKALKAAGAKPEIFVFNNLTPSDVAVSVDNFAKKLLNSQALFIPGGISSGGEPDGCGKFIAAFCRDAQIKDAISDLLDKRLGLICGIGDGFHALIRLGLVPFGKITDADEGGPFLTFNRIGRHQSKLVRTRIASNKSPWLADTDTGEIYTVPISHGEGRFAADEELILKLADNGQIATQYVDFDGNASNDVRFNPSGSAYAIEGITSPDGRVFGKMGHCERCGDGLYKNTERVSDMGIFRSAVNYFK